MQGKIRILGKRHFDNNFIIYFILFMFLFVGIVIGSILVNRLDLSENYKLIEYLNPLIDYIKYENPIAIDILKSSLLFNSKCALIIWLSGLIFLGSFIIPLIIGLRGISIGFTVGFLVKKFGIRGFAFALSGLLPHYLILLPGIIAISSLALSNAYSNGGFRYKSSRRINKMKLVDYSLLFIFYFLIIIIGSLVESFITPYFIKLTRLNL